MLQVRNEIYSQLESLGCKWVEVDGTTWVLAPDNMLWSFSVPKEMTGTGLSSELDNWVMANIAQKG